MSTPTTQPRPARADVLGPLPTISRADLATVRRDRDASTREVQIYRATSDRDAGCTYTVRHDDRADVPGRFDPAHWSCDCPAGKHGRLCKHLLRSACKESAGWWYRLLRDDPVAENRALIPGKAQQAALGPDSLDAQGCLHAIAALDEAAASDIAA